MATKKKRYAHVFVYSDESEAVILTVWEAYKRSRTRRGIEPRKRPAFCDAVVSGVIDE
jgi:hypothetical protein